jgi:N-acetylneuraminic acid mutarotase
MNLSNALCLFAATALTTVAAPAAWERLAPLPVPNGGFIGAASGDGIIALGGVTWKGDTKIWLNGMWSYDPGRNAWREIGNLPVPLAYSVSGSDGTTVWFAGGSSGDSSQRSLWRIAPGQPPRVAAPIESALVYAAGGLIGTTLYAAGGTDDQAAIERITNRFVGIDIRTGQTTRLADYPEASLTTGTAAAVGGKLYVFGGARWDPVAKAVVNHASAHVFSPDTNRWERLPPLPHPGRGYTAVALDARRILIAGGYRNDEVEFVSDAYVFDTQARTFTPTLPLPYAAMVTLIRNGEWLYCLGGEDRKRHRTDAVFRIRWQELLSR